MQITNVLRPYYLYQPAQIVRRVMRMFLPARPRRQVRLPWGATMEVDPTDEIGGALWRNGIYDLAVSEVAWRLTPRGGTALDIGANIGCVTTLLAMRVGPEGQVHAVEPHPAVRADLERNVVALRAVGGSAPVTVHPLAIGEQDGALPLVVDGRFATNRGTATLAAHAPGSAALVVPVRRLDGLFGDDRPIDFMKVDVEGHEGAVFGGAARLLAKGVIRHVLYEDHAGAGSAVHARLQRDGYTVFAIGWRTRGVCVGALGERLARRDEAPSFVATRSPDEVLARLAAPGWRVLGR